MKNEPINVVVYTKDGVAHRMVDGVLTPPVKVPRNICQGLADYIRKEGHKNES